MNLLGVAKLYYEQLLSGKLNIEDIPESPVNWRAEVKEQYDKDFPQSIEEKK